MFHNSPDQENGYVICSRQNQETNGNFPYIQQGTLGVSAKHYLTDGMQFFGKSYKGTNYPEVLDKDLPDVNYQFEFAYIGLQTEKNNLQGKHEAVFYGIFKSHQEEAISKPIDISEVDKVYNSIAKEELIACEKIEIKDCFGEPYLSQK